MQHDHAGHVGAPLSCFVPRRDKAGRLAEEKRLMAALERLQTLHDEMALRHALLGTGLTRLEGLRATMIAQLDALVPDPDLEPSLAHPEYRERCAKYVLERLSPGGTNDWEEPEDDEYSLCGLRAGDAPSKYDYEAEHDGREPTCEDEGAQCEDEGHDSDREEDQFHGVPDYAEGGMDQTRIVSAYGPGVAISPMGVR